MTNAHATRPQDDAVFPLDPTLQSKLAAKFGPELMRLGFTALPVVVQKYYRYVPGNPLPCEVVDEKTGEVKIVEKVSSMTPTEYAIMTAIWSYWWTSQSDPWPNVEHIRSQVGKSERQVRRYLQRLRDKGFLLCVEQYNSEGKQISNRYDFTPFLRRLMTYLETLELPATPEQKPSQSDRNDRVRVSDSARSGCQNEQGIEDESESDSSKTDSSDSSGGAADQKGRVLSPSPTRSHIAHGTIGRTNEETQANECSQRSNPASKDQEHAVREHVKEVEVTNTNEKVTKFEEFVLASGVPLEELHTLETWMQNQPRPTQVPLFIQVLLDPVSQSFENKRLIVSNRTQATKLYLYARSQGMPQEELEDAFREWVRLAFMHVPPHITKKMAWFFRALKVEMLKSLVDRARVRTFFNSAALVQEDTTEQAECVQDTNTTHFHSRRTIELGPDEDLKLGWPTTDFANWCAKRLCKDLGKELYEYEVLPTVHQRWGVELRLRCDHRVEGVFLDKQEMYDYRARVYDARAELLRTLEAQTNS